MKVVVNSTGRGLLLSHEAVMAYCSLAKIPCYPHQYAWDIRDKHWIYWTVPPDSKDSDPGFLDISDISRTDPILVKIVESNNPNSNHYQIGQSGAELKIVEIPDDVNFEITFDEMLDREIVREISRTWF